MIVKCINIWKWICKFSLKCVWLEPMPLQCPFRSTSHLPNRPAHAPRMQYSRRPHHRKRNDVITEMILSLRKISRVRLTPSPFWRTLAQRLKRSQSFGTRLPCPAGAGLELPSNSTSNSTRPEHTPRARSLPLSSSISCIAPALAEGSS